MLRVGVRKLFSGLEVENCAQGKSERTVFRVGIRELYLGLELEYCTQGWS